MNTFPKGQIVQFQNAIEYTEAGIVSKQIMKNEKGNVTLFAFSQGEGLSEHTAPFDALVQVIDGHTNIKIGKETFLLKTGDSIIMPANISHALQALTSFKMLLTMIKI